MKGKTLKRLSKSPKVKTPSSYLPLASLSGKPLCN